LPGETTRRGGRRGGRASAEVRWERHPQRPGERDTRMFAPFAVDRGEERGDAKERQR
jgi:hypothetical protein